MHSFNALVEIIGINPFVFVPEKLLSEIFQQARKNKGPIPVCGTINGTAFKQTLVKYSGHWRLYINTTMLKDSPKRIGETVTIALQFDPSDRTIEQHPSLQKALTENPEAKTVFDSLPPSRQKEIVRYISSLKTKESVEKNVARAIQFLLGKHRFAGRDKP